jgi:hypothetical protein
VPRIDYSAERPARPKRSADRRGGLKIAGAYGLLLEQERMYGGEPDPRWAYTEACRRRDPYPESRRGPADLLPDLESGSPVQVDWGRLEDVLRAAGELTGLVVAANPPQQRVNRFFWDAWRNRSSLLVYSDDVVVPVRRGGQK